MASGMLIVSGTIDLSQFWPQGQSDADTAKILLTVGQKAFQYRTSPSAPLVPTSVFNGAKVKGANGAFHPVMDKWGRIVVRLQGIDAPELHYQPQSVLSDPPKNPKPGVIYRNPAQKKLFLELNEEYRQPVAETATFRLHQYLKSFGTDPLPCKVITSVDEPNQVFDTYGRFIGDILIGHKEININHWLVREGWATPAFYTSMSNGEILTLKDLAEQANNDGKGIWPHYQSRIGSFKWNLLYRRPNKNNPIVFDEAKDVGSVIFPKLFRRLTTWAVNRKAKMVQGSFKQYLAAQLADKAMLTQEFLQQGPEASTEYPIAHFLEDGKLTVRPEELVIKEKPSTLIPAPGQKLKW